MKNLNENDYMIQMNRKACDESLHEAIAKMVWAINEAQRDLARPDDQMTATQKIAALHRHFANGLSNAAMDLNNAAGYATALVVFQTKKAEAAK